jgi:beta-phosphoglucomutase
MIKAAIFDLDGTVLDNEGMWEEAFSEVGHNNKIDMTKVLRMQNGWYHEPGTGLVPNWQKIVLDRDRSEHLARQTWMLYREKVKFEGGVKMMPGVEEALTEVNNKQWLTALCTGSIWHVVEKELEELKLYLAFDVTTTGEELQLQKPDPEIYTLTATKLGVEPYECLVIEDSIAGVRAGLEAGMMVAVLISGYAPEEEVLGAGAQIVVKNFSELTEKITELE